MKGSTKRWLVIAAVLVIAGCMAFGGVMSMLKWDFSGLSTVDYETRRYEISEEFRNITVTTNTAEIVFSPSESDAVSVVCREEENSSHTVAVKDGTLVIENVDTRKWYEHIGIHMGNPKITVYIPRGEWGALTVKSDTGAVKIPKDFTFKSMDISGDTGAVVNSASALEGIRIRLSTGSIETENISAASLDLSVTTGGITLSNIDCAGDVTVRVSTGRTELTGVVCKNLLSTGDTGSIQLRDVIASERFSIERSTGDVRFDRCDAAEIFVETDTGSVSGSLLTDKVFIAHTDTGTVNVPDTASGGRCEIRTDTGSIKITVQKAD